jgi:hypothetical protein
MTTPAIRLSLNQAPRPATANAEKGFGTGELQTASPSLVSALYHGVHGKLLDPTIHTSRSGSILSDWLCAIGSLTTVSAFLFPGVPGSLRG